MKPASALAVLFCLLPPACWAAALHPQDTMVHIQKAAGDGVHFAHGSGIYLGGGLVLTADHVINHDPAHSEVKVLLPGNIVVAGEVALQGTLYSSDLDIALIRLDPTALPAVLRDAEPTPVCAANPGTDRPMLVAAEGQVTSAMTIPQPLERRNEFAQSTNGWTNLLSTGYHHGASGGGVFDPGRNCLEGIISLELTDPSHGIDLTSFIPANRIQPFLDAYFRRKAQGR